MLVMTASLFLMGFLCWSTTEKIFLTGKSCATTTSTACWWELPSGCATAVKQILPWKFSGITRIYVTTTAAVDASAVYPRNSQPLSCNIIIILLIIVIWWFLFISFLGVRVRSDLLGHHAVRCFWLFEKHYTHALSSALLHIFRFPGSLCNLMRLLRGYISWRRCWKMMSLKR